LFVLLLVLFFSRQALQQGINSRSRCSQAGPQTVSLCAHGLKFRFDQG
jgi:hypothetical protein